MFVFTVGTDGLRNFFLGLKSLMALIFLITISSLMRSLTRKFYSPSIF